MYLEALECGGGRGLQLLGGGGQDGLVELSQGRVEGVDCLVALLLSGTSLSKWDTSYTAVKPMFHPFFKKKVFELSCVTLSPKRPSPLPANTVHTAPDGHNEVLHCNSEGL